MHTEFGPQSYRVNLQGLGPGLGALRGDLSDHRQGTVIGRHGDVLTAGREVVVQCEGVVAVAPAATELEVLVVYAGAFIESIAQ